MPRYVAKPIRAITDQYPDWNNDTRGSDVIDTGDWSEDQPTGILTTDGQMIYRTANRIGFLADN